MSTLTRMEFLTVAASASVLPALSRAESRVSPKVLLVVAHPDDEYYFAATVYRTTHDLGGVVDQVVLTNGEAGFKYAALAETVYGAQLSREEVGRARLPEIRRQETLRAGRILGIRDHYFLNQKDARFTLDSAEAFRGIWDTAAIHSSLTDLLGREHYDFVFVVLPLSSTHGHHQAAALLALEAVGTLPVGRRPAVLGALLASPGEAAQSFKSHPDFPVNVVEPADQFVVSRRDRISKEAPLDYSIVVNWVIAEHKSQGLFQTECNQHDREVFYLFRSGSQQSHASAADLFARLRPEVLSSTR